MSEALLKALSPGKALDREGERIAVANTGEAPPRRYLPSSGRHSQIIRQ